MVVDASAIVHLLITGREHHDEMLDAFSTHRMYSTEYLNIECANAFRRLLLSGEITPEIFTQLVRRLEELSIIPVRFSLYSDKIVRHVRNISVYDAAYVAVAEHMGAPLMTTDTRLRKLSTASIEFFPPNH